ncbi:TraR/DksA family transcriptional regulator [Enterobacter hormaechei]|uniref:TraR/DksA family transcriptional regulator n=1 Tax=Enterobacter hormaechei TaxID=158836 RepID=UPI00109C7DB2|nr:TraR/DksA family transcriptional regulator [Enterobacter hormaechei]THA88839.1 TraR/DksA family transcriptional regulator [Enterobacter hormaechei]
MVKEPSSTDHVDGWVLGALSAHRLNRNAVSAEHCEECDEPIPEPRRAAVPGCQTCASCQADLELIRKQRGS